MLSQVVYETNADLAASHEAMVKNPLVVADRTEKGLLWFKFRDNRTVFLLSPLGKLQVKWNDVAEKRTLFRLVRSLLVGKPNEKLVIKPVKQQTWIEYPVPDSFKVYWCDTITEFVLVATSETPENQKEDKSKRSASGISSSAESRVISESRVEMFQANLAKVRWALEELRREFGFLREPTFNEIALKSGCLDSRMLRVDLTLAGWKAQSPEEAKWIAEKAINVAGWLRFKETGKLNSQLIALCKKTIDSASLDVIGRAQTILKNSPDLVPYLEATELKWPDETKTLWIKIFGSVPP